MTEFKLEPINQLVIQDLFQESLDNYLYQEYVLGNILSRWVDGMILEPTIPRNGEQIYKNMTNGIKYYEKLTFVKYPKYEKSVKWNGGNYELALLNYNNNPRFRALAKWIKTQPVWETIPEKIT